MLIRVRRPPDAAPACDHSHWERTKPGQRKFLSRKELCEKYSASDTDLERVAAFARSKELKVLELHAARRLVIVTGTVRQLNHAFAIEMGHYEPDDEDHPTYRGREGQVHVPKDIQHLVEGVFGLDDRRVAHRLKLKPIVLTNNGPGGNPLTPVDIANLYNFPPIPANMSDQTIGILEFGGGYTISPASGRPTDVDTFVALLNASYNPPLTLSPANVIPVPIGGGVNQLAGQGTKGQNNDLEVALDIEVVAAVANGSPIAVYFATGSEAGYLEIVLAAIFPDNGQPAPSVISTSWDADEANWSASALQAMSSAFQQAAEAGITILATSGDHGTNAFFANDGKAHVEYPASDPWITTCGGTQISNINWTNSTTASAFVENTWNQGTPPSSQSGGITGGGISTVKDSNGKLVFPLPSWQQGFNVGPSVNDGTTVGRGIPDIAGHSNGYNIRCYGQPFNGVSGTSEAAPLYAGLIARINATLGFNVGYLNPTLYSLFSSPGLFNDIQDNVSNAFTFQLGTPPAPVTLKTSPGYSSVAGWDARTGLGSLNGTKLLQALAGSAIPSSFFFSVSKNTFGSLEVNQTLKWPAAFSLVLDGFSLAQVVQNPVFSGSFMTSIPGVTIMPNIPPAQELGGSDNALQRITFLFDIIFAPNPNSYFPGIGHTSTFSLAATLQTSVPGTPSLTATAQFELSGAPTLSFST